MKQTEQYLLARIVDLFAEKFGKQAILRGGMVLRIMGSPRYTNDLDYLFVPYHSKKEVIDEIMTCLRCLAGAKIQCSLNSKCLRAIVSLDGVTVQVEAKVAMEAETLVASTSLYSPQYNLPKRLIHILDHRVSMADKMAAWNERRLVRDVYDIWFFHRMQISPDHEQLLRRLKKPVYSRLVPREEYFFGSSIADFYDFFRTEVFALEEREIRNQLSDYLPEDEIASLPMLFRAAFASLIETGH